MKVAYEETKASFLEFVTEKYGLKDNAEEIKINFWKKKGYLFLAEKPKEYDHFQFQELHKISQLCSLDSLDLTAEASNSDTHTQREREWDGDRELWQKR